MKTNTLVVLAGYGDIPALVDLSKVMDVSVVASSRGMDGRSVSDNHLFKNAEVIDLNLLEVGAGGSKPKQPLPESLIDLIDENYRYIDALFDRIESFPIRQRVASIDRRVVCLDTASQLFGVVQRKKVHQAFFTEPPHSWVTYILYLVIKDLNITYRSFQKLPFSPFGVLMTGLSSYVSGGLDLPDALIALVNGSIDSIKNQSNIRSDLAYMEKQELEKNNWNKLTNKITVYKNALLSLKTPTYVNKSLPFGGFSSKISPRIDYIYQEFILGRARKKYIDRLGSYYEKLVSGKISKNSILVALHYQPERTSLPDGGKWFDQLSMIHNLIAVFGDKYTILVKEHKSQHCYSLEAQKGRTVRFYDSLNSLPSVRLVDVNAPILDLIDNVSAVATLTGTIGFESVVRGKPVLCFGSTWYLGMDGVFDCRRGARREMLDNDRFVISIDPLQVLSNLHVAKRNSVYLDMLKSL